MIPGGQGTEWEDALENMIKGLFWTHFSDDRVTGLCRVTVPFLDGTGNQSAFRIFLIHFNRLDGITNDDHAFVAFH